MPHVNDAQIAFGRRLGLDFTGKTVGEALAMIHDVIQRDFEGNPDLGSPSEKQIALAAQFQRNIATASKRVGAAVVDDLLTELNHETIRRERLAAGVKVMNKHDPLQRERVISSISDDGTVYFRGGNGAKAWARSLYRIEDCGVTGPDGETEPPA